MTQKKLDLIDIIEAEGLGEAKIRIYADILPLYASIDRRSCEDDALHACARYIHKHREHYMVWVAYEKALRREGSVRE